MGRHSEAKEGYFCLMRRSNGYYYYWVYDRFGKRIYRSTGKKTRPKAMDVAMRRWKEGALVDLPKPEYKTFGDYAASFWAYDTCPIVQDKIMRGGKYLRGSARSNQHMTDKHITPYFEKTPIAAITTKAVTDWLFKLPKEHKLCNKSVNNILTMFRQIMDCAVNEDLIDKNPVKGVKPLVKNSTRRGSFSASQVKQIFSEVWENDRAYTMCLIAACTGMRLGEVQALTKKQVKDGYLDVCASWSRTDGRKSTKSGYGRIVPIDGKLQRILKEILPPDPDDFLFTLNGRNPICSYTVRRCLYERMDKLNIDHKGQNLGFHSFRHFFNTRLVASGVNSEQIRAVIGHESEEMTEHYLHLSPSDMEGIRAVQRGLAL